VGHGPFSHAFEAALKKLDKNEYRSHEAWTADIIRGDTSLGRAMRDKLGSDATDAVAQLLLQDTPTDIYSSIVSSQFDADRLDYVRRDRLMTGAQYGAFDYSWILANLEVAKVAVSIDDEQFAEVDILVLGHKAFQAAESYVLGLFHLYFTVYFHKATRSAECMMSAMVERLGMLILRKDIDITGLFEGHPLVNFVNQRSLESYLGLDDSIIWGSLPFIAAGKDQVLATLAQRLLQRDLYKAVDVTTRCDGNDAKTTRFRMALSAACERGDFEADEVFVDTPSRNPYTRRGYDTPEALKKVLIYSHASGSYDDLANQSEVIRGLSEKKILRVYVRDNMAREKVEEILKGI